MLKNILILLLLGTCTVVHPDTYAQASLEVFGQNRIQYRRFDWKFYEADHFKIYHYDRAGRELARYVAEQAEKDLAAIEKKSAGLFSEKLSIVLYNSYDDFQQSNIGLNSELQMQNNNPAGTVSIIGDKLIIYFTGKHADLKRQLRQGMAQVVMEHLMYGDNLKELVRNAVLFDLPEWFTTGYVDYVVDGWTSEDNNDWKNMLTQEKRLYFNEMASANPRLGGKAFWKFIAEKYGDGQIRNLLYVTQLKGNLNKTFKLILNQNIKTVFDTLLLFYQDHYQLEGTLFDPIDLSTALIKIPVPDNESEIRDIMVSPRGADVAYVKWKHGEYDVIIEKSRRIRGQDHVDRTVLLSGGSKNYNENADPDYPLMAWNNTGFKLGIIFKNRNNIRIKVFNSVEGTVKDFRIPASRFDRITGFTFMEDDAKIVLSAVKRGQSDLFELRLRGARLTQLTDDAWDDQFPVFVSGGSRKGVVFLSNRPEPFLNIKPLPNELPAGRMNAFFYNATTKNYDLLQLTNEKEGSISQIIPFGSDHFAYLSDKNGVNNRYVVLFGRNIRNEDSAYAVPVTNYSNNIRYQQYNAASGKIAEIIPYKDTNYVYFRPIALPAPLGQAEVKDLPSLPFVDAAEIIVPDADSDPINLLDVKPQKEEALKIESGDYFQTEFSGGRKSQRESQEPMPEPERQLRPVADTTEPTLSDSTLNVSGTSSFTSSSSQKSIAGQRIMYVDSTFVSLRPQQYHLSFKPDFFSVRLDNSVIFNRYQSYTNSGGRYQNPSLAGMLMARLFDKMEDYRFTGGIRIPANFSGLTYFVQFENFRRRTDWGLIFLREEKKLDYNFLLDPTLPALQVPGKTVTNILQGSVHYPLDKVRGFHFHMGLRQDQMVVKAENIYGLALPDVQDAWMMSRMEFIHDNTRNPAMNIWNGIRYKIFTEYMYKIYTNNDAYTISDGSRFVKNGGFYNVGVDFRYYYKIYKDFIAAVRFASAHSGGNQQIIYYLGGKENAINAKSEFGLPPSNKNNYAFQSLAANLRGYGQNARNGNTYALINAELRLPVVSTFFKRPVQSSILNHLQTIAFVDVGSAWEGLLPNDQNLNRNYVVNWPANVQNPAVSVQIPNYDKGGVGIGYGAGLRTMLFGYFAGVDMAWNINRRFHWYITIGTDF